MGKYVLEEKKKGKLQPVGKPMGARTAKVARALLSRTSGKTKRKNRLRAA